MRFQQLQVAFAGDVDAEVFPTGARRALVVHAPLGRRANDALARALSLRVDEARGIATDHGFALLAPRAWRPTRAALVRLLRDPIEPTLRAALDGSDLLRRRFRHVATRALVLRRDPGESLGMRQQRANVMLARLMRDEPGNLLLHEAMQECLHDALDLAGAEVWREGVVSGSVPLQLAVLPCASPRSARVLAPPGEARHESLRDAHDAISYQMEKDSIVIS
jgi:ATP-dependent Lhr-like helicase